MPAYAPSGDKVSMQSRIMDAHRVKQGDKLTICIY
jgi:hypothetical protein